MKAITIIQPWASLIISGQKRVENRTWATEYRGPLLIHAGQNYDQAGYEFLRGLGIDALGPQDAPRGVILGRVDLVDIVAKRSRGTCQQLLGGEFDEHLLQGDPLASGPICWVLRNPQPLPVPIPASGKLGIWEFG